MKKKKKKKKKKVTDTPSPPLEGPQTMGMAAMLTLSKVYHLSIPRVAKYNPLVNHLRH